MDKLSADGQRQIDKVCIFVAFAAKNKQFFRKKKQNEFLQKVCFHRKKQTVLSISEDKLQQRNFLEYGQNEVVGGGYQNLRMGFCPRRTKIALNHPVIIVRVSIENLS